MNLYSLNTLAIALIALGLIIPTGAVMSEGSDQVWEDHGIVLSPHDSPNGEAYAKIGPDGNLTIDLATVGVNPNALTTVRNLFDITNNGESVAIWVTHNATETVRFSVAEHGSIQGKTNNITIGTGDDRTVDLLIDTEGMGASEEPILTAFNIHVKSIADEQTPTDDEEQASGGGGGSQPPPSTATPVPTPTPTPTETPSESDGVEEDGVEVILDEPTDDPVSVQEIPTSAILDDETDEDDQREPRAVISHAHGGGDPIGRECPCENRPEVQAAGANTIVEEGEELTLSAARSLVGSVRAVDPERRMVKAVDINVPAGREESSATIRMRVSEDRFEGSELTRPRVGRETDDGWQMLPTRIVGQENGQLILEARTPGFSRFAVFATPEVRYAWQLGDETITAEELRTRFDEPGYHNVTLNVTDGLGRTNTATYRVLVNDRPDVSIDVPANRTAGEPLTLRANVTNEIGNATVTWLFPDGSQQEGLTAEYAFERGDQPIRVTVADEYGATTTIERTITIGPVSATDLIIDRIASGLSLELALGTVGLVSFVFAILLRRLLAGRGGAGFRLPMPSVSLPSFGPLPTGGSEPRIVAFENPTVDVANRRFTIGHLRIEDPDGNLRTVDIVVTDGRGNEVAQKTVDLRGESYYVARNEIVLPKSKVFVRDDQTYEISVRAGDDTDGWVSRQSSSIRAPAPVGA